MIDLHMHSTFSDGELIPSEVVSRCLFAGYTHLAITDHVDPSNVENVVDRMVHVCSELQGKVRAQVYPGVEITHVPPRLIAPLAALARERGAHCRENGRPSGVQYRFAFSRRFHDVGRRRPDHPGGGTDGEGCGTHAGECAGTSRRVTERGNGWQGRSNTRGKT